MARWEAGTPQRLQQAALELFTSQGYEQTTAAEIARSVGLTERTFFRHFSDKREVLFYGQEQFVQAFLTGVDATPAQAPALDVVVSVLRSAATLFPDERRAHARARQAVIEQNAALRERELHKLAGLAGTIADALRARGVDELAATVAAQTGITVFGIAFGRWIREGEQRSFEEIALDVLAELQTLTAQASARVP